VRALLVDVYGTLVEEDDAVIASIVDRIAEASAGADPRRIAARWNERFSALCAAAHGDAFRSQRVLELESLRELLQELDAALDPVAQSRELFRYWRAPTPCPGAAEALASVPVPVCLVSNIDSDDLAAVVEAQRWNVAAIVTSESVRAYKPRPEIFEAALEALGCARQEVLHIGDSLRSDIAGAESLGIPSAWINRSGRVLPAGVEPRYVTRTFAELERRLAQRGVYQMAEV